MAEDAKHTVGELGEFALIDRVAELVSAPDPEFVRQGIGDDCAILRVDEERAWLVSTDLLVETVHFRLDWTTPRQLGWKSVAVNLSDLAAMGADPRCGTIGLSLPSALPVSWVEDFFSGADEAASRFGLSLVGGDTTKSPQGIVIAVTVIGESPADRVLLRSEAEPGDLLVVTGALGDAAAGLRLLQASADESLRDRHAQQLAAHLTPRPQVAAGVVAREVRGVHAAIDLSDGLAGDLRHLCRRSRVGAEVELSALPRSEGCKEVARRYGEDAVAWALSGGEDYELLWTVSPSAVDPLEHALRKLDVSASVIGRVWEEERGLVARDAVGHGRALGVAFDHFSA